MAHPIKNLMEKISALLKADSNVIALLANKSVKSVIYGFHLQTGDYGSMPFISISPNNNTDSRLDGTNTRHHNWENFIVVEYVKGDKLSGPLTLDELVILDDAEKIEAVLQGSGLANTSYTNDRAELLDDGIERIFIKEEGVLKMRYTLKFQYLQNK